MCCMWSCKWLSSLKCNIYDPTVIFNDISLLSRTIIKDRRRKVYLQLKVDRYERFVLYMFMNGSKSTDVKALDKQQQTKF